MPSGCEARVLTTRPCPPFDVDVEAMLPQLSDRLMRLESPVEPRKLA